MLFSLSSFNFFLANLLWRADLALFSVTMFNHVWLCPAMFSHGLARFGQVWLGSGISQVQPCLAFQVLSISNNVIYLELRDGSLIRAFYYRV